MRHVLVLRPEPGSSATMERARELGLSPVSIPLFEVQPVEWKVPDPAAFDALLLTSSNAVRCAGAQLLSLRQLKAFAVGETTAQAARRAGFDVAGVGVAGVDQLLGSIDPNLKLLHLCGEDRKSVGEARQPIVQLVAYRSVPIDAPDLSPTPGCVALVHSARAARRFAHLVGDRKSTIIAAISSEAAKAAGRGWERVEIAHTPVDDALLALAARLCNNSYPT